MTPQILEGVPIGQEPLLKEAPCDCDPDHVLTIMHAVLPVVMATVEADLLCPIGASAALASLAASLVNPANMAEASRGEGKRAALKVASVMEEIAAGIRKRATT